MESSRALLALLLASCACAAPLCDISAPAPHGLVAAREEVRLRLRAAERVLPRDITVCVGAGTHTPLALAAEDAVAGRSRVQWVGEPGAVMSGGLPITGWAPTTLGGGTAFMAPVPSGLPPVVRQLWVGGVRATRTRTNASALGSWHRWNTSTAVGFTVTGPIPSAWLAPATMRSIELAWPIAIANWIEPRCTIASIDVASRNITLTSPCGQHADTREARRGIHLPTPGFIEAAPTFPLPPGSFFHNPDEGRIYYAIREGQTAGDLETSATAAAHDAILLVNDVTGHSFVNISFAFSSWGQANEAEGFVDQQSAVFDGGSDGEPPGAVRVSGSHDVTFSGCAFSHMGAPYALEIANSSSRVAVQRCSFDDLSGGAVKLGSVNRPAASGSSDPAAWDAELSLTDSTVSDAAIEYSGAAAVFAGYVADSTIAHNSVSRTGYTGISMGWGWGVTHPPGYGNNSILNNRLQDVMQTLRDGGGVYVNGAEDDAVLRTSVIGGNYVLRDEGVFAAVYVDNGGSWWVIDGNVVDASPLAWAFFLTGSGTPARNNVLRNFWYRDAANPRNDCAALGCVVDASTIHNQTGVATWPPAAQAIIDAAGVRPVSW